MSARPERIPDLGRWASERAPELIARAEAEAVAVLRDALVAASLAGAADARVPGPDPVPDPAPAPDPQPMPDPAPVPGPDPLPEPEPVPGSEAGRVQRAPTVPLSDTPDLLWAYCVLRGTDRTPPGTRGIDGAPLERIETGGLAALVSHVPGAEFAQEPLTRNLNDLAWLERVARAHEAVLDAVLEQSTIVPLRMCTIFQSERGVTEMLERRQRALGEALDALHGRLEWAVKVLVDRDRLIDATDPQLGREAEPGRDAGHGRDAEPVGTGAGGAYLRRRRDERGAREAASRLAADTAQQIHARLQDWALDARTSPPQNRELSGYEGEMVLNAAYLIERERSEELPGIIAELEEHHRELGTRIELSGPWPPYNFVPGAADAPTPS